MEGEITHILQLTGVYSSPVDPSSMKALVQLMTQCKKNNVNLNGHVNGNQDRDPLPPLPLRISSPDELAVTFVLFPTKCRFYGFLGCSLAWWGNSEKALRT